MQSSTPVQPITTLSSSRPRSRTPTTRSASAASSTWATEDQLREALAAVDLTASTPLRLHLSELDFCDVNSLRHLLTFTRTVRDSGRAVEIEGARGVVRRLILLLGVEFSELSVA